MTVRWFVAIACSIVIAGMILSGGWSTFLIALPGAVLLALGWSWFRGRTVVE